MASLSIPLFGAARSRFPGGANRQYLAYPNVFSQCLGRRFKAMQTLADMDFFRFVCCPRTYDPRRQWPWLEMPQNGRRLRIVSSLPVSSFTGALTGTDVLVAEHRVPIGCENVVVFLIAQYTGAGFVEGSGDITWRLRSNLHWEKDYANVQTTLGSASDPYKVSRGSLRSRPHSLIRMYASVNLAGSGNLDPNARIICGFGGWEYPQQ